LTSSDAANLDKVDHVVVVMLENRSFDHMLGYLSLTGGRPEIDGLRTELANQYQGRTYPVHHLGVTALEMDPDHSAGAIDQQIAGGDMSGFVASAAATLASRGFEDGDPGCVMGYYGDADVPVYDHLAEEFAVCDRWFASVPGATLPNRLYALCGMAAGSRDDRPSYVPPLYHQPSFVRHLDSHHISWRWYSFDPGTLRLADVHYRLGHHHWFGYFSKTGLPWKTVFDITCNPKIPSFLEDAAAGTLRQVSWIDPAFTNFNPLGFPVNDDHPMADIKDGQDLVLAVYDALASSPNGIVRCWSSSTTKTAASTITSRHRKPQMTSQKCSAATACGCQRSSSRRGSNRAPSRTPCSITPRSSKRSCRASAPKPCSSRSRPSEGGPGWAGARNTLACA
jgi:phospholipase C